MDEKGEFEQRPEVKPASSVPLPKEKASPALKILCVVFALIALGLGGYIAYDKLTTTQDVANCIPEVADEPVVDNFAETNKEVKKIIQDVSDELTTFGLNYGQYQLEKSYDTYVTYEFEKNYMTNLDGAYGVSFYVNSAGFDSRLASSGIIEKVMNNHGLKKISFNDAAFIGEGQIYYSNDDGYICNYSSQSAPAVINCANSNWLTEEDKTLAKSLIDAMKESDEYKGYNGAYYVSASADRIEKTADGKYERITASITDAAGLFYRKTGGKWKFLTGVQQAIGCDWFNTDELRAAYAGASCYDYESNKMTTL